MADLISIDEVNALPRDSFVDLLGDLYEHSPAIVTDAWSMRPFRDRVDLFTATARVLAARSERDQVDLLRRHPEFTRSDGEADLTADSSAEQAGAGLWQGGSREELFQTARAYTRRHGFPGVICVREHEGPAALAAELRRRIGRSTDVERRAALAEVEKIAWHRLTDRVMAGTDHGGYLTTHVLDTSHGIPGAGMGYDLRYLRDGVRCAVASGYTDADGRSPGPILAGGDLIAGAYEIEFRVGEYFAALDPGSDREYLEQVPVRFTIDRPDEHYHAPLIVSRWGYTTYRGS